MNPLTLVTFEAPAARHLIEEWREEQGNRIMTWNGQPDGSELVQMVSGEWLYIVPLNWPPGPAEERALGAAVRWMQAQWYSTKLRFDKMLHFGKVPVRWYPWTAVMKWVAP